MPIIIDDIVALTNSAVTKALTPKYFSSELTGSGGAASGLLNQSVRPGRYPLGSSAYTMSTARVATKSKTSGSGVTTIAVPFGLLTEESIASNVPLGLKLAVADPADRLDITQGATKLGYEVFLDLTPQGLVLQKDENGDKNSRSLDVLYRMEVFVLAKGSSSDQVRLIDAPRHQNPSTAFSAAEEFSVVKWSYAPLDDVEALIAQATGNISPNGRSVHVDVDDVALWMSQYDVYERICRLAVAWSSEQIAEEVVRHISELFAHGRPDMFTLNRLASQLRYLETYDVSLEAYRQIHTALMAICTPDVAVELSKQNVNLLMSYELGQLASLKPKLATPPTLAANAPTPKGQFSKQQLAAVTTDEKLVLVQAGAGTGKSTVILGRIGHLVDCGVDPSDITVLSFTNAAADNITAKCPSVGSMTIARMIHDIYSENHTTHELSSIDTMLNSIDIYYPNDEIARGFRVALMNVNRMKTGSVTYLNSFVEKYADEVIAILNRIRQTCLELEIIVAYQQIDTMSEPSHISSRYLIIDEVQDNSVFEFIYLLKYVTKHLENLYIVGDASQTLYEFRASNPKALNALEESGVFATYQLTTNYRSNQEILDFANVHLADIEANQTAGLQLRANSLAAPTVASFKEKVTLSYNWYPQTTKFLEDLPGHLMGDTRRWIEECLARGEQVAFLAYSRREVTTMQKQLTEMFPNETVASLVSDRSYSTTVFSQYVKLFWNDVCQVDPGSAVFLVFNGIRDNLAQLVSAKQTVTPGMTTAIAIMTSKWFQQNGTAIHGWAQLCDAGQMTTDEFFQRLLENILDFEIQHNSIKQTLLNQRNRERKEKEVKAGSRLVVSTIHGVKGLEFDNVLVVHKYAQPMTEEFKRMYYVAMTRAMHALYVLSYGTVKGPRIESDYNLIVAHLAKRDAITQLRAQGLDVDAMSDDELAEAVAVIVPPTAEKKKRAPRAKKSTTAVAVSV